MTKVLNLFYILKLKKYSVQFMFVITYNKFQNVD